jgi:hypothetical protein
VIAIGRIANGAGHAGVAAVAGVGLFFVNSLSDEGAGVASGTTCRAARFADMPEYQFDPPLTLKGDVVIRTLDDAVRFLYTYKEAKRPILQGGILHRMEGADTEDQQRDAANAFLGFAEEEGLIIRRGA